MKYVRSLIDYDSYSKLTAGKIYKVIDIRYVDYNVTVILIKEDKGNEREFRIGRQYKKVFEDATIEHRNNKINSILYGIC